MHQFDLRDAVQIVPRDSARWRDVWSGLGASCEQLCFNHSNGLDAGSRMRNVLLKTDYWC